MCQKRKGNVNCVEVEQSFNEFNLFNINSDIYVPPEIIYVKVNGTDILMEIDSGAATSVITEYFFKNKLLNYKKIPFFKECYKFY